jgi:hypothetical protein
MAFWRHLTVAASPATLWPPNGKLVTFTVGLQALRRGNDQDGRHYMIAVSARDNAGNLGRALATVTVPRN